MIPAAGRGSRWAPISGYLPKEMLPLIDKPVIEWVIDEVVASGCNKIIIVINKQKKEIRKYLLRNLKLKNKVKLYFVNQNEPLGIAHAIFLCKNLIKHENFAVALPDLPTIARKPVLKQLIGSHKKINGMANIVSFNSFPSETLHFFSECLAETRKDGLLKIIHFCPKEESGKPHHPGNKIRMSGRYIFNSNIFPLIKKLMSKQHEGELKDTDALKEALTKNHIVLGLEIQGHTYDTGTPAGYVRANTAFFKKKFYKKL